ncbi:integrin alpha-PS2-like [Diadema antillarum]|uniref:integrin alpha-PS2-like n=1 Tax=Diadema antillarum TaxID=105358 RepID=UPI003A87D169
MIVTLVDRLVVLEVVWMFILGLAGGFNIDESSPIVFRDLEVDSRFGQALALHQRGDETMLVVGAPKGQSANREIVRGGVAYKCSFTNQNTSLGGNCSEILLDRRGNDFSASTGEQISNKSDQWLGAAMGSGGPNGPLVICRPRYQYYFDKKDGTQQRDLLGGCFVLGQEDFENPISLLPCISGGDRRCQFGFSVDVHQDHIMYGAIGLGRHEGQFWTSDTRGMNRQKRPTKRGTSPEDDIYMGYAVASGNFKDDSRPEYAVTIPRHKQAFGKVVLYNSNLEQYHALENGDMGSYFGHTLVVSDLNNDGWDDLVIAAPLFTDLFATNSSSWEIGRVFIYYNDRQGGFGTPDITSGRDVGGRFGYSAVSLGDINVDGFNDLAIAAPFIDAGRSGKVFIYHGIGYNVRLPLRPVQILESSQFGQSLIPFGSALSSGVDIDGNSYPDLAVGAYKSQVAVVYRSRPSFTASIQVLHRSRLIDLDVLDTRLLNGQRTTGLHLDICITFTGYGLPETVSMEYSITLDAGRSLSPRVVFLGSNSPRLRAATPVSTRRTHCFIHSAYVKTSITDKQTPVAVLASYWYLEREQAARTPPGFLVPVLSRWAVKRTTSSFAFKRNCANTTCAPNLIVSVEPRTSTVTSGGSEDVYLVVDVENDGEDAFYSILEVLVPDDIFFSRLDKSVTDAFVTCSVGTQKVVCNIGNPVRAGGKVLLGIVFQTEKLSVTDSQITFSFTAKSGDDELPHLAGNNHVNVSLQVISRANITLQGDVNPELLIFKESHYPAGRLLTSLADVGPRVTHTISFSNSGPSFLGPTELVISWPAFAVQDGQLFYPVKAEMDNGGDCYVIGGQWNPDNLTSTDEGHRRRGRDQPRAAFDRRRPRDAGPFEQLGLRTLSCTSDLALCDTIVCYVDSLGTGANSVRDEVVVTVTSRFRADVLIKISMVVLTELQPPQQAVLYWVYGVAVAGGLLIQLVLIFILKRVGFFKRKKISPKQRKVFIREPSQKGKMERESSLEKPAPVVTDPLNSTENYA